MLCFLWFVKGWKSALQHPASWRESGTECFHLSFSGSSVWKAFYFTQNFYPENKTGCFHTHICFCTPEYVTFHDPPLLFDLSKDPSESTPLTPDTEPAFHSVLATMKEAVKMHRRSLKPVENQLSHANLMWKPWLQPCCSTVMQLCQCQLYQ